MGMLGRSPLHCLAQSRVKKCHWRLVRKASSWTRDAAQPSNTLQTYISKTHDPYLNLSIEHYLLNNTPPSSTILFLYINRPCIVIGRNQNPWLEANLNILNGGGRHEAVEPLPSKHGKVDLIRRRSGGGTVFHDLGNVNWTVICPSASFTRDKHAEMVVRALRSQGVDRARVNKRHDIVLDQGDTRNDAAHEDLHRTPWTADDTQAPQSVKVSGSAYKLIRGRALHHATCLLSSPNLQAIPRYLHSPAKPFIKAKGVDSVSSPVSNIGLSTDVFHTAVLEEFWKMYASERGTAVNATIGEEALDEQVIRDGWNELQTPEWMVDQTPQFTFATHAAASSASSPEPIVGKLPSLRIHLEFRHGRVTEGSLTLSRDEATANEEAARFHAEIQGRSLRESWTWDEVLNSLDLKHDVRVIEQASTWLQQMLPTNIGRLAPKGQQRQA